MLSHFIVGDPVQCAFTLQVVAETAFTNIAFVALPDVGARNGDFTLPTTYLSVQSDEARHISNGYATLLTVLQEDDNAPLIERDLGQAWWINHAYLDGFGSGIMEYGSDDRSDPESYMDKWERWIENDWYRSYVLKLGKLGLNFPPEMFDRARKLIDGARVADLDSIASALRLLITHNHIIAEGAGACPVACALSGQAGGGKVVCIVSGGNIDPTTLCGILTSAC